MMEMKAGAVDIEAAGEVLTLLPQRAVFWPAMSMLVIADIHFGKAASFRAQGIPVPRGTTTENLEMLTTLVAATGAKSVLFLGDFLHARHAHAVATMAALQAWRERHSDLALTLVRGNHDSHAGDPPPRLGIKVVDEPYLVRPFVFAHHPQAHPDGYVLAGHVHPVYRLAARGDALRLPCYLFGTEGGLLPSFGAFTGGYPVAPTPCDRLFLATPERVIELNARGRGRP
ncbi:ligase-associated DNA damage response endonuclease PdeM [Noviherbaspirillum sp. L7-7A]|uniref:ligase-associated DNA damage response endonuclease PdeM n=1 Tax=Noviherbaspirillum sp. L7-7A TaxID=2850560 RepID=UPI0032C3E0DF